MSFLAPKMPALPAPAAVASADTQTEADKAAEQLRARARKAGAGRQSTVLTSPLGATGAPSVVTKTLLGQ
jgi:hypothetical protein